MKLLAWIASVVRLLSCERLLYGRPVAVEALFAVTGGVIFGTPRVKYYAIFFFSQACTIGSISYRINL
ncbi:hypothetical protein HMPREF0868_1642 [Mageeibacillus indolicus UPII9-5]|uniref:Uncharacterized protein n=1 Tax=Mageeibacillus indolicus (strain UPII9-5) TaxID=699246 RepID=D3QZJ7_MAGIU|nr:hypothetical protein HMPREF0868_1642 [Mageeibacillus indolicus UPII9-5]KFA57036.1 hypothetical protein HMPREF1632_06085 [Mageeibacillus indolicus 0009-5]